MADQVVFDFAVPDELLGGRRQERNPEAVADLASMPGTGEGKPPPLVGILNQYGYSPLVLLTLAALVPGTSGTASPTSAPTSSTPSTSTTPASGR